jgi:FkbM family methyltransferase
MYSQNNEEEIILKFFKGRYPTTGTGESLSFDQDRLTVLDIGANDGEKLSNSKRVIECGWSAVLVEASPSVFPRLHDLHRVNDKVQAYNVALSEVNGKLQFYESDTLLNEGDYSLVSTLDIAETARWKRNGVKFRNQIVDSLTFNALLSENPEIPKIFNLISIDIEGKDWEVLTQIDLNLVGCEMLIIEFNGKEQQKYVDYGRRFGMELHSKNPENLIFVTKQSAKARAEQTKKQTVQAKQVVKKRLRKQEKEGAKPNLDRQLSILIPTLPARAKKLGKLLGSLTDQIVLAGLENEVQILYLGDTKEKTVGEKRNNLLQMSTGKYVCFIDDDDLISKDYIAEVWKGIQSGKDVVTFSGVYEEDSRSKKFVITNDGTGNKTINNVYYRLPHHLCPTKERSP